MPNDERLISTTILQERIEQLEQEVEDQRKVRSDDDPFFKHAAWLIEEWRKAIRDAEREYAVTGRAAQLTGWNEQTLRKYARAAEAGEPLPEGWQDLRARKEGTDWVFCVSTIPMKGARAA